MAEVAALSRALDEDGIPVASSSGRTSRRRGVARGGRWWPWRRAPLLGTTEGRGRSTPDAGELRISEDACWRMKERRGGGCNSGEGLWRPGGAIWRRE